MALNCESTFQDRGEYSGLYDRVEQLRSPDGLPRERSTGERARLLRKAGLDNNVEQGSVQEFGVRLS